MVSTRTVSPYFSPKKATAPFCLASRDGQDLGLDRQVAQHALVGQVLDLPALVGRHGRQVREVEAQPIGRDQRALLRDVRAQHLAQRPVQEVGGRVVAADGVAALDVDREVDAIADLELALADLAPRCT